MSDLSRSMRAVVGCLLPLETLLKPRSYVHPDDIRSLYPNMLPDRKVVIEPVFEREIKAFFQHAAKGDFKPTWCLKLRCSECRYVYDAGDTDPNPLFIPQYGLKEIEPPSTFFIVGNLTDNQKQHLESLWRQGTVLDQIFKRVGTYMHVDKFNIDKVQKLVIGKLTNTEFWRFRERELNSNSLKGQGAVPS